MKITSVLKQAGCAFLISAFSHSTALAQQGDVLWSYSFNNSLERIIGIGKDDLLKVIAFDMSLGQAVHGINSEGIRLQSFATQDSNLSNARSSLVFDDGRYALCYKGYNSVSGGYKVFNALGQQIESNYGSHNSCTQVSLDRSQRLIVSSERGTTFNYDHTDPFYWVIDHATPRSNIAQSPSGFLHFIAADETDMQRSWSLKGLRIGGAIEWALDLGPPDPFGQDHEPVSSVAVDHLGQIYAFINSRVIKVSSSGEIIWQSEDLHLPSGNSKLLLAPDGQIIIWSINFRVLNSDGQPVFGGDSVLSPLIGNDGLIYTASDKVRAIDFDGNIVWESVNISPDYYLGAPLSMFKDGTLLVPVTDGTGRTLIGIETGASGLPIQGWPAANHNSQGSNVAFIDADRDAMNDLWESMVGLNPADPADALVDSDNDGLSNLIEYRDYLDLFAKDTDGDGLEDGEEQSYNTNPRLSDTDEDGLTDGEEVKVHGSNPHSWDSDGDSLSDYDEVVIHGSSPVKTDTDSDGMPDRWELQKGTKISQFDADEDLDSDGATNLSEFQSDTDPSDPAYFPGSPGSLHAVIPLESSGIVTSRVITINQSGHLFLSSLSKRLYALTEDGAELWNAPLVGTPYGNALLDLKNNLVYQSTDIYNGSGKPHTGKIYAFNATTGELYWEKDLNTSTSLLVLGRNNEIVGRFGKELVTWNSAGEELWRYSSSDLITTHVKVLRDGTYMFGTEGGFIKRVNSSGLEFSATAISSHQIKDFQLDPAQDDRYYVITDRNGSAYRQLHEVHAVSTTQGILWSTAFSKGERSATTFIQDGELIVLTEKTYPYIVAFKTETGAQAWDFQGSQSGTVNGGLVTNQNELVVSSSRSMFAVNKGQLLWKYQPSIYTEGFTGVTMGFNGQVYSRDHRAIRVINVGGTDLLPGAWAATGADRANTYRQPVNDLNSDLSLKLVGHNGKNQKGVVKFSIDLENLGVDESDSAVVTVLLPELPELTLPTFSVSQDAADSCSRDQLVLTCSIGYLTPGERRSLNVQFELDEKNKTKYLFQASILGANADTNLENNSEEKKFGGAMQWLILLGLGIVGAYRASRYK